MSRLMLFVERGEVVPVVACVGYWGQPREMSAAKRALWEERKRQRNVIRWWEVECENAEAGRAIIAGGHSATCATVYAPEEADCDCGKVLASSATQATAGKGT